jgi:anaerobic dimethyl sulfoxide reductase subunit B (iron-sulfur subunit)
VQHDDKICIGCKNCMARCPYGVPQWKEDLEITGKCSMCSELWDKNENPACINACPQFALEWGYFEELKSRHPDAYIDLPILPSSVQTDPSTIITPRDAALNPDFRQKHI